MAIFWGSPEARTHEGTAFAWDTVDYTDSNAAVFVDLGGRISGGYAEGDRFVSIEDVWGSRFDDTLVGDDEWNGLYGHHGNDSLTGGGGRDTLRGEAGNDTIDGGAGRDWVYGDQGADRVSGGDGSDLVWGGKGMDTLIGGSGNDYLEGGADADTIYGAARTNAAGEIIGPGPQEEFWPTVAAYTKSNAGVTVDLSGQYQGGAYSSVTKVSDGSASGTVARVQLTARAGGHAAGDVLYGVTDVDGSQHGDVLIGNDAANGLWGLAGNDTLSGGAGDDGLHGGSGADSLAGGDGNDVIRGGRDNDTIAGDAGDDLLEGHAGNDTLSGGAGDDWLRGGSGADSLAGGDGNDVIRGGRDNDTIAGGRGNDELSGDRGNDTLSGGTGQDTLTGWDGTDRFVLSKASGGESVKTTITDFEAGEKIDISAFGMTAAQLQTLLSAQGRATDGRVTIDFGSSNGALEVFLWGDQTALTAGDFIL